MDAKVSSTGRKVKILSIINSIGALGTEEVNLVVHPYDDGEAFYCKEQELVPFDDEDNAEREAGNALVDKIVSSLNDPYDETLIRMSRIRQSKSSDYGDTASKMFDRYGVKYFTMMVEQKMERIRNLADADRVPNHESIDDSFLDAANYCVMAIAELRRRDDRNRHAR